MEDEKVKSDDNNTGIINEKKHETKNTDTSVTENPLSPYCTVIENHDTLFEM